MKYLSFVVPSYNAEKWLEKCVNSLLYGKDDVEIIIVNDGSKDNTLAIAKEFEKNNPGIVKVIDKENGGHGSTINAALEVASGLYFKCVDSDDWVDADAYQKVLDTIKKHDGENQHPDMYLTNFVYENLELGKQFVDTHVKKFPKDKICTYDDVKRFGISEFIMMHNVIYRLAILKQCKMKLLEHTFYVDNLYVYKALPYVKSLYYIDADFYRYYVGRPDQSVTLANVTKNYKMQIAVNREMVLMYSYDQLKSFGYGTYRFIIHDLVIKSHLTLFYIVAGYNKERKAEYKAFLKEFKEKNPKLYSKLRFRTTFLIPFLLIPPARKAAIIGAYKHVIKKTHWN